MKNSIYMFLFCFIVVVLVMPIFIKIIRKIKAGQNILSYVDKHIQKQGTPTMGGIIIVISLLIGFLIFGWSQNNFLSQIVILVTLFYAILGFLDDFIKIKFKQNLGLKAYQKLIGQLAIATIIAFFVYNFSFIKGDILLPFSHSVVNIGYFIVPFIIIFYLAVVNSVNLIDGLDGLCGGVSFFVILFLSLIITLNISNNYYYEFIYVQELENINLISFGLIGAILGFLCFNTNPAKVFMGDTGSLAIGGFIASVCCFSKNYLLIVFIGVMYVITTLSDILQVIYFKLTKKRIFKMAPLHHHFELNGCNESKIVAIYIIITIIFGLSMLSINI